MAIKINFDNSFSNLPNKFYSKIAPEKTKKPSLIILNKKLCDELKLDSKNLESSEGINFLNTVWEDPSNLPELEEIENPSLWISRIKKLKAFLI